MMRALPIAFLRGVAHGFRIHQVEINRPGHQRPKKRIDVESAEMEGTTFTVHLPGGFEPRSGTVARGRRHRHGDRGSGFQPLTSDRHRIHGRTIRRRSFAGVELHFTAGEYSREAK